MKMAKILSKWGDEGSPGNERTYTFRTDVGKGLGFSISDLANQGNAVFQAFDCRKCADLESMEPCRRDLRQRDGNRRLYVNGALVGCTPMPRCRCTRPTTPVTIGASAANARCYPGLLRRFELMKSAFTTRAACRASEIQAIYADGTNGKFDPNEFLILPVIPGRGAGQH